MSKLCFNLNDVIGDIEKMHLTTLQRAAEISPYVTERTLGPDLDAWDDRAPKTTNVERDLIQQPEKGKENINKKEVRMNDKNPQKVKSPNTRDASIFLNLSKTPPPPPLMSFNNLDCQAINMTYLLKEVENKRKNSVRQQILDLHESQSIKQKHSLEDGGNVKKDQMNWIEKRRQNEAHLVQEAEQQAEKDQQKQGQQIEILRKQTQRQLQIISFQAVAQYQHKFRNKYEGIANLLVSIDKQALLSCTEYNRQLKELIQTFEKLLSKLKSGDYRPNELKTAEGLCKSLDTLESSIINELENIVKREQQKADKLRELQAQEEQKKLEQQKLENVQVSIAPTLSVTPTLPTTSANDTGSATPNTVVDSSAQYVNSERFQFYSSINNFYMDKVERVKPLQFDESMKKYRFACQKAINIPVNAISAVTPQHLQDKFEKLYSFICGQPQKTVDGQISVNDHPLGRDYCILLMAKKFVSQGDTAISSNPQAAFPVASVIVSLWKLVPDFGQIFLAYVFKESPFLVPYFIPQKRGQPIEEYYKVLGYRVNADGMLEQQDMYLKRQAGIARLYAAIMITNGRQAEAAAAHPYPLDQGWRWLTNFVQLEPLPDICATLMLEFLQIIGSEMWTAYGKQLVKLLLYIQKIYFPKLSAVDEGGPKARLELLLGKFLREGQLPKAQGILPVGFW